MLASARDYVNAARGLSAVVLLAYVLIWIFVGGYLLRRSLAPVIPKRKLSLGRCILAMFLSSMAAAFAGGVILGLYYALARPNRASAWVPGAVLGFLGALGMVYLVVFAMFELGAKQVLKRLATTLITMVVLLGAVGVLLGVVSNHKVQRKRQRQTSVQQVRRIRGKIVDFKRDAKRWPGGLNEVVDRGLLKAEDLTSPIKPDQKDPVFYFPPPKGQDEEAGKRLMVCEMRTIHDGRGRAVAYASVEKPPKWLDEDDFQAELKESVNAEFAKALRAKEGE